MLPTTPTKAALEISLRKAIEYQETFNHHFDLRASLLTPEKGQIDENAVMARAWFFLVNRLVHHDSHLSYSLQVTEDDSDNLLCAIDSAYLVAEEELSTHVGQSLIALFQ